MKGAGLREITLRPLPLGEHFVGGSPRPGYATKREAWAAANKTDGAKRPGETPCSVCRQYHLYSGRTA